MSHLNLNDPDRHRDRGSVAAGERRGGDGVEAGLLLNRVGPDGMMVGETALGLSEPPTHCPRRYRVAPTPPDGFEWPAPWEPIASEAFCSAYPCFFTGTEGEPPPTTISAEVQREACPGHPLYGVGCQAVAKSRNFNEFLLLTTHPEMPLAFVHLTWRKEEQPTFPWVRGYESWEAFRQAWLDTSSE
jgi:hypothetical protein